MHFDGLVQVGLECASHVRELTLHAGVPVVLDGVVGPAVEHLSNFRPLVFEQAMHQEQNPLFFLAPVDFLNFGVQVIVPALTTLLADSPWELLRDRRPFLGTVLLNELKHFPVLFLRPGSLDDVLRRVPFFFLERTNKLISKSQERSVTPWVGMGREWHLHEVS